MERGKKEEGGRRRREGEGEGKGSSKQTPPTYNVTGRWAPSRA